MTSKPIILAAGVGLRLAPISTAMPKSLIKVSGKEIIKYQIEGYLAAGVNEDDISVVVGYMADRMDSFLKKNYPRINVITNGDYSSTNNMYSLYLALNKLSHDDYDVLFVNNADCAYDHEIISELLKASAESAIAVEVGMHNEESMKVSVNSDGRIVDIAKTIGANDSYGLSIDLYKLARKAVVSLHGILKEYIEINNDLNQWTEVAFPELFKVCEVKPHDIREGRWFEIDNLDDLAMADRLFSDFRLSEKEAFIVDLDGTLFIGNTPIEEAVGWVKGNQAKYDFYFLTNNTSRVPRDYTEKLSVVGIEAKEDNIATPLHPLSSYIRNEQFLPTRNRREKLKSIYLIANDRVLEYMKQQHPDVSFEFDFENNQAIVLTYDNEITFEKLRNACVLLNNKSIEYLATHIDVFCPTEQGRVPDIGSYIALIEAVTHKRPSTVFGKPDQNLIKSHVEKYGVDKLAIVGDRLYTDKVLADNAGVDFICVLTGETSRFDIATADFEKYPATVLSNLGELPSS